MGSGIPGLSLKPRTRPQQGSSPGVIPSQDIPWKAPALIPVLIPVLISVLIPINPLL